MQTEHSPLLVIIGTTASGKSDLAVDLALRYGGEVVSADSRQIYRFLDETTGKIPEKEMRGVLHHMLAIADPGEMYNAHEFADKAMLCVRDIREHGNLPIIAGGSGFYIDALLFEGMTAKVPADPAYRKEMEKVDLPTLQQTLQKKDGAAYKRIDVQNPRRLIRALEIIRELGVFPLQKRIKRYEYHMIGIKHSRPSLHERIAKRLDVRFEVMIEEIQKLLGKGVTKEWFEKMGLECRHIAKMLTENVSQEETRENLTKAIFAYAKRQETWLRRYPEAAWYQENQFNQLHHDLDKVFKNKKL